MEKVNQLLMKYTKIIFPLFILIFFSLIIIAKNYAEKKKDRISFLKNQITQLKKDRDNTAYRIGYIPFEFLNKKNFKLGNFSFELKKYNTDLLNFTTGFGNIGSSYIDYYDNKLFFVTAKGVFSYGNFSDIEKEKFNLLTIKNNFAKILNTDLFYKNPAYGIKDILIVDDEIFISFTDEIKKNCYNTSILQAKLNTNNTY